MFEKNFVHFTAIKKFKLKIVYVCNANVDLNQKTIRNLYNLNN